MIHVCGRLPIPGFLTAPTRHLILDAEKAYRTAFDVPPAKRSETADELYARQALVS